MTSPLKSDFLTDNKPVSLSVKNWIIRKLAPKMMFGEKTIEAVIDHQFQEANRALLEHKSLEISGFGKFFFNEGKAAKRMLKHESQVALFTKKLEDVSLTKQKRKLYELKLQIALDSMRDLKLRMYAFTDLQGMEEPPSAVKKVEDSNIRDEQ